MRSILPIFGLAALCAVPMPAAEPANPSMVVSTGWLAAHLDDPSLAILHVGAQKDYDAAHIPGARLVTLPDISITSSAGLHLEVPPVEQLEGALGRLGISNDSRVVIYAAGPVQAATRVWFTLDYAGMGERASLLDGGLAAWKSEGRPLSAEAAAVAQAKFTARPSPERIVDAEWVRQHMNDSSVQLLDVRPPESFAGSGAQGGQRTGHIPGARNAPLTTAFDSEGKLKSAQALREILVPGGGPAPAVTVMYCNSGQQASVMDFVARYLGLNSRLYDGSMQDWSARPDYPIETGMPR